MEWHLTWQDPIALALVVLVIVAVRWAKKKLEPAGCAACTHKDDAPRATKPVMIGIERLRLGRRPPTLPPR